MAGMILLCVVGIVGGGTSLTGILSVWSDGVLAQLAGWLRIPDDSTLGRIFKTAKACNVAEMETVVHKVRAAVWKRALRSGTSIIGRKKCITVDADSTVKTVFGNQEGAEKGYNPHKRGAKSVHPLLAYFDRLSTSFAAKPRKFYKAGTVAEAPIPVTELSSSCDNYWRISPMMYACFFAPTADFLTGPCWIILRSTDMLISSR
jgi:hypothetical protein